MKTRHLIGLQKDIYESLQKHHFIKSKANFQDSSIGNKEAIFKAVLTLLDTIVNNPPRGRRKKDIILDTSFD